MFTVRLGKNVNMQKAPQKKKSHKKCEPEQIDVKKIYQDHLNRVEELPKKRKKHSFKKNPVSVPNKYIQRGCGQIVFFILILFQSWPTTTRKSMQRYDTKLPALDECSHEKGSKDKNKHRPVFCRRLQLW